jgi:hypothetical protein
MPSTYALLDGLLSGVLRGPSTTSPGAAFAQPDATYVGLFTAAPTASGGGTEVSTSGTGYARQQANFNAPVNGVATSTGDIVYSQAVTSWGTVTHFGIFDAASGGNLLYFAALQTQRQVLAGDQVKFPSGQLTVTGT